MDVEERKKKRNVRVSQLLVGARNVEGLSRHEAAEKSGVSIKFIAFFEGEEVNGLNDDIFTRNKLTEYSRFLGFDPKEIVSLFRHERLVANKFAAQSFKQKARRHPLKEISFFKFLVKPNIFRASLIALAIIAVGIFFTAKAYRMVSPPKLILSSPQEDGLVINNRLLTISGHTEKEAFLSINGKLVTIDEDGKFTDQLDLRDGLNVITVTAIRKHGQKTEVTRRIVVDPSDRPTATLNINRSTKSDLQK